DLPDGAGPGPQPAADQATFDNSKKQASGAAVGAAASGDRAPQSDNSKNQAPRIVVESSGTVPGLGSAIRAARPGGTVVAVGQVPAGDVAVPASLVVSR